MKLTKIIACLSCCVALCVPSAFAVDEVPWTTTEVGTYNAVLSQSSVTWTAIVERVYREEYASDAPDDTIFVDNGSVPWFQGGLTQTGSIWSKEVTELPAKYDTSENSRYVDYHSVAGFTIEACQVRFSTTVILQPGYYEVDFGSVFTSYTNTDNTTHPANTYSWYFVGSSGATVVPFYSSDRMRQYVELNEPSRLCLNVSYPSYKISNTFTNTPNEEHPNSLIIYYSLYNPNLKYRTIDTLALEALDAANTGATTALDNYNGIESQWTGSMTENFNALGIGNFAFGSSLISAFALISRLFMTIWDTMGDYAVVYTFPLYLGIVLLTIGRINKSGGRSSSSSGGTGLIKREDI